MDTTRCRGTPRTKPAVAVHVKGQALEEPPDIAHPITPAFEHLEFVVQPFNKTAGLVVDEVVRNPIKPGVQQLQEAIEAGEATAHDAVPPPPSSSAACGRRM